MINAQVQLQGFDVTICDATQDILEKGQPTGDQAPVKVLRFQDSNSAFAFNAIFTPEQFDVFADQVQRFKSKTIHLPGGRAFWQRPNGHAH
jgi:hypothetical protein